MAFYSLTVRNSAGTPCPSTTVTVKFAGSSVPAPLYKDAALSVSLANPVTSNAAGVASFYVAEGLYDLAFGAPASYTRSAVGILNSKPTQSVQATDIYVYPNSNAGLAGGTLQAVLSAGFTGSVSVDDYGAAGDGVTDDTLAIRAAITACGANGQLIFRPNKTYRLTAGIRPMSNQTWYGYGSKLKRCDQITDTTSTNIAAGPASTVIAVTNPSQWAVGMSVCVFNGALYDTHNHNITAVSTTNSTITVDTAFTQAFAAGGTVISSFNMIDGVSIPNVKILGLELDGNKTNNTSLTKWELQTDIYGSGCDYLTVRECYVHDSQCEGIQFGGTSSTIENNTVLNTNGNGIHYSGIGGGVCAFNYVKNCNLAGATAGHVDGCIIFSDNTNDSFIVNNYCENGVCGIGSIDTDNNSSVVIQGNIIKSCTVNAIEGIFPTLSGGRVTIVGNLIYDSINIKIQNTGSMAGGVGPYNWLIDGNFLSNTRIYVQRAFNITVSNNQLTASADVTNTGIYFYDVKQGLISGNQILGFQYGINIDGSVTGLIEANLVTGNTLKNQKTNAILFSDASGRGMYATNNSIQTDSAYASATYDAIFLKNNTYALGNMMDLLSGRYGIHCPNGAASTNGGIVQGNVIRSTGITASIRCDGGSINNLISYNFVQQAISNAGTNTLTGNQTIF